MAVPMGEAKLEPHRVDFDRRVKPEFHGDDIPSDGALLPCRELDHALGPFEASALAGAPPRARAPRRMPVLTLGMGLGIFLAPTYIMCAPFDSARGSYHVG